jgi:hypothetical protein
MSDNKLVSALVKESNKTTTFNGADTFVSTTDEVLDLFSLGAAMRGRSESDIVDLFMRAFNSNKELAMKCLFYIRDVRGGQGERRAFRAIIKHLAKTNPSFVLINLSNIVEFGRFDDLFSAISKETKLGIMAFIRDTLLKDISSKNPSLLAKWMPSENTSSKETRELAKQIRKSLGFNSKQYRTTLSLLRKKIKIVEREMSSNNWSKVEYKNVPSRASMIYRKAFVKHDGERYSKYLKDVEEGKSEIKASTLYPMDLVRSAWLKEDQTLDLQWKSLPNFIGDKFTSALVMADVSGSMSGTPMEVAISLALYISERAKGPFKDVFMTFTSKPQICQVIGDTLTKKVRNLRKAEWGYNTNLQSAFDEILRLANESKCSQEDLPQVLFIVSDMEFDRAVKGSTNFEEIERKFKESGFEMPKLVFWNVNAMQNQSPVTKDQRGVYLVSGYSPSTLKYALNLEEVTPVDMMMSVLNSDRYSTVKF